jgi:surfactin synthase thioesterase subunit
MMSIPLLCFPFAGAGASFFRPWKDLSRGRFELLPIQLPGREKRFVEEPYRDVAQAIEGVLPDVLKQIEGRARVALFGHSMGAVLAFELARRLTASAATEVELLVVSGSPGP